MPPSVAEVRATGQPADPDPIATLSPAPDADPIAVLGEAGSELTAVQFWTFRCRNCKNTLPALQDVYAEFGDRIEIVGVNAPEFGFEADVDNVAEAAVDVGVTWPIALDTDKRHFHRWQEGPTAYWPRVSLIDGENQIRFDQRGDGIEHYLRLADLIERLLAGEA